MLKKRNGFSMIEVLFASTLFFQAFLLFVPIHTNIQASLESLSEKRWAAIKLHDELQHDIHEAPKTFPKYVEFRKNDQTFYFKINQEGSFLKGCVEWENAKEKDEIICLYGQLKK